MPSAAQITKITESMQCLFLAVRFHANASEIKKAMGGVWDDPKLILGELMHGGKKKGKWSGGATTPLAKLLIKYGNSHCHFGTKEGSAKKIIDECYRDVPPDTESEWWTTYIKIANVLFKSTFKKGTGQKFHRGSKWVSHIESKRYKIFNDNANNFFSGVDKWQPADIWMTTASGEKETLDTYCCKNEIHVDATLFEHGNKIMLEKFASRDIIPISLKKVGASASAAKISEFNTGTKEEAHYDIKFTGASLNKEGNFWKSMDVYVFFKNGGENAIQFRSFTGQLSSWKGELSGTVARAGKIGPEILERYLDGKVGSKNVGVGIKGTYKLNGKSIDKSKLADQDSVRRRILGNTNALRESKLEGTQLKDYKKSVARATFNNYLKDTYKGKKRLPLTKAGKLYLASEFIQDFYAYYKLLVSSGKFGMSRDIDASEGTIMNEEEFTETLVQKTPTWIFSKYCGMVMLATMLKEKLDSNNVNALVEQWGLYAYALSPHSAPFIKIS
jgi:hypothetical protein